ncbi:MAG TPA: hypothetical protein PK765_04665 [bacterium]|nr:hypothetical protein [bacterium]
MKIAPIDPVFTGEFAFVFLCSAVGTLLLVHALLRFHAVRRVVIERPWLHPNAWSILRIILGIAVPVILWSQLASRGFCFDLCWTATITAV